VSGAFSADLDGRHFYITNNVSTAKPVQQSVQ